MIDILIKICYYFKVARDKKCKFEQEKLIKIKKFLTNNLEHDKIKKLSLKKAKQKLDN